MTGTDIVVYLSAINERDGDQWYDVITVEHGGVEIGTVMVEPSESAEPYEQALRDHGYEAFRWDAARGC